MTIVRVRALDAAGRQLAGVEVVARLVAGQRPSDPGHLTGGGSIVEVARRRTNAAGIVDLELVPNVDVDPRDTSDPDDVEPLTYYDVAVGPARRAIVVPPSTAPVDWSDPAIAVLAPTPPDWAQPGGPRTLAALLDVDVTEAEVDEVLGLDPDGVWRGRPVDGGGPGTVDHRLLEHRDAVDQHPIAAITGLGAALDARVEEDDPRLVDARTPTAHAATHAAGGSDPLVVDPDQVDGLVAALEALDTAIDDEVAARAAAVLAEAGARDTAIAAAVDALVDGAPTALDTLRELAAELADQDDALAAVLTALDSKVGTSDPRLAPDPTAAENGMVAVTESGLWVARTAAQVRTVLGLGTAALRPASDFATAAQGAKADGAAQAADLHPVATSGAYAALEGRPALGTAAAEDVEAFDPAGTAADAVAELPEVAAGPGIALDAATPGLLGLSTIAADVQDFTASGTWTKPDGATLVIVLAISGGGGGASGRKGAEGTLRFGGGGGASGGAVLAVLAAATLGATEAVTVGAGGAGGAARTTNNSNGVAGVEGGATSFGPVALRGGGQGWSGSATGGEPGVPPASSFIAGAGGAASTNAIAGGSGGNGYVGGGGAGGTRTAANASSLAGANGGSGAGALGPQPGIGPGGQDGGDGTEGLGGAGGAGGNVGIAGGNGGWPGGGGGGGGAGINDTTDSGAGGDGADGFVRIITLR